MNFASFLLMYIEKDITIGLDVDAIIDATTDLKELASRTIQDASLVYTNRVENHLLLVHYAHMRNIFCYVYFISIF